jgi:hypothetical protein
VGTTNIPTNRQKYIKGNSEKCLKTNLRDSLSNSCKTKILKSEDDNEPKGLTEP